MITYYKLRRFVEAENETRKDLETKKQHGWIS